MILKFLTHWLFLRIANLQALFLLVVANIIRLAYFKPEELIVDGVATTVQVSFRFVIMTIFVLPPLIAMFALMEFKFKREVLSKWFNYLDYPVGKGVYMIMMALIIIEVQGIVEIIFTVIVVVVGVINIVVGVLLLKFPEPQKADTLESEQIHINKSQVIVSNFEPIQIDAV